MSATLSAGWCVALLFLGRMGAAAAGDTPSYWYSAPPDYESMWMKCHGGSCKGDNASIVEATGPHFAAYVYYELGDWAYDKRTIYTSYIQPMPDDCEYPGDCDGRKGNNEFDMIETGFVGYNDTWFVSDNSRCLTADCGGKMPCQKNGEAGCSWVTTGSPEACRIGDYNDCNSQTDPDHMPLPCTWTDVQNGFSMCTQSAALDPMKQDFTQLSANGYLHGETGPTPYGCSGVACNGYVWTMDTTSSVVPVNNRRSYSVGTGDGKRWGNRWIRLELDLDGDSATYTYRFFEPGNKTNHSVSVTSAQSFTLKSNQGKNTFDDKTPHYWIFTMWQYSYEFAVPTQHVWDSWRHLHYYVVKDNDKDSLKHLIKKKAGDDDSSDDVSDDDSDDTSDPDVEDKSEVLPVVGQKQHMLVAGIALGFSTAVAAAVFGVLAFRRHRRETHHTPLAQAFEEELGVQSSVE